MTEIPSLKARLSKYTTKPSEASYPEFMLFYSQPGSGKTYLAATVSELPTVKSVLIIDTEGSTTGTLATFDDNKIDIVDIRKTVDQINAENPGTVTYIAFLDQILSDLFTNGSEYDAVVLDTLDVAQDWKIKERQKVNGTKGDKDKDGKTINGSRQEKVFKYIDNLKLTEKQKAYLKKLEYSSYGK